MTAGVMAAERNWLVPSLRAKTNATAISGFQDNHRDEEPAGGRKHQRRPLGVTSDKVRQAAAGARPSEDVVFIVIPGDCKCQ